MTSCHKDALLVCASSADLTTYSAAPAVGSRFLCTHHTTVHPATSQSCACVTAGTVPTIESSRQGCKFQLQTCELFVLRELLPTGRAHDSTNMSMLAALCV